MNFKLFFNCWWLKLFGRKTLVFRNYAFFLNSPKEAWYNGEGRYVAGRFSYMAEMGQEEYEKNKKDLDVTFSKIPFEDMMVYNIWVNLLINGNLVFKKPIYINEEDVQVGMKIVDKKEEK